MFNLTYASSAVKPFTRDEHRDLIAVCVRNNRQLGVTGMLLYKEGNFMQVLEGEEPTVRALHARILRDPRHRGLINLLQVETSDRQFPDWSMAFRDLDSPDVAATAGFSEFMNTPLNSAEFADPSRCQKLLLTFKRTL